MPDFAWHACDSNEWCVFSIISCERTHPDITMSDSCSRMAKQIFSFPLVVLLFQRQ